jgi:hypothetical protein
MSASPGGTRFTKMPISFGPRTSKKATGYVAAPLGFLVAGQVLEHWGVVPLFTAVVLGITWMAVVFAAITWRHDEGERAPQLATT